MSVTRTRIVCEDADSKSRLAPGATSTLLPFSVNRPAALLSSVYVNESETFPSVVDSVPTNVPLALFSATLELLSDMSVGGRLTRRSSHHRLYMLPGAPEYGNARTKYSPGLGTM